MVERTIPELELKYKYKIPFYYLNGKPFCYFNASHKRAYVDVGFCRGNQIEIYKEHLITEKRKKMSSLRYKSLDDVDSQILIKVLEYSMKLY